MPPMAGAKHIIDFSFIESNLIFKEIFLHQCSSLVHSPLFDLTGEGPVFPGYSWNASSIG